jgi:hypothetical protein
MGIIWTDNFLAAITALYIASIAFPSVSGCISHISDGTVFMLYCSGTRNSASSGSSQGFKFIK